MFILYICYLQKAFKQWSMGINLHWFIIIELYLPWTGRPKVQKSEVITQIDSISNPTLCTLTMGIQPVGRTELSQVDTSKVGHDRANLSNRC